MKTLLTSAMYLEGVDKSKTPRLYRNIWWLTYHKGLNDKYKFFDDTLFFDNGSKPKSIFHFKNTFPDAKIEAQPHLAHGRTGLDCDYRNLWRTTYKFSELLKTYDKIINIDTDTFILSQKCLNFIKSLDTGWHTFWSTKHNFAAAEIQVISKDMLPVLEKFTSRPVEYYHGKCMERTLPFTHVHKDFIGDRYGEEDRPQTEDMDWYSQTPWTRAMIWNMRGVHLSCGIDAV